MNAKRRYRRRRHAGGKRRAVYLTDGTRRVALVVGLKTAAVVSRTAYREGGWNAVGGRW